MDPTIEVMPTTFIYPIKIVTQEKLFSGRQQKVEVATGEYHIFEVDVVRLPKVVGAKKSEVKRDTRSLSLCGKSRSDIGEMVKETEKAPGSNVCKACAEKYKNNPRSPYYLFTHGKGIKV